LLDSKKEEQMGGNMHISDEIKEYLIETAKWTRFLAIIGFIGIGLLILIAFSAKYFFSLLPLQTVQAVAIGTLSVIYFILAGIYFFPVNYLFKFSGNLKSALEIEDQEELTSAFKNLKSHYKFIGIFVAIVLSLYAMLFIMALLGIASTAL